MQIFRQLTVNSITFKPEPFHREIHLQGFLVSNEEVLSLGEEPFVDPSVLDEEVASIRASSPSGRGRIDILVQYSENNFGVVEIKKIPLEKQHFNQLKEYVDNIDLELFRQDDGQSLDQANLIGILVGPAISTDLARAIEDGLDIAGVPVAALVVERFTSGLDNFVVTTPYFKLPKGRDYTKYMFNGRTYGKAPLVRAVLQDHIDSGRVKDLSELNQHFPKDLQGRYGVFSLLEDAKNINEKYGYVRYYTKPDDIRRLLDNNFVAVCSQWGKGNLPDFISRAKDLGYSIEEVR